MSSLMAGTIPDSSATARQQQKALAQAQHQHGLHEDQKQMEGDSGSVGADHNVAPLQNMSSRSVASLTLASADSVFDHAGNTIPTASINSRSSSRNSAHRRSGTGRPSSARSSIVPLPQSSASSLMRGTLNIDATGGTRRSGMLQAAVPAIQLTSNLEINEPVMATLSAKAHATSKLTQLAQEKLNFSRLCLVGRDVEQRVLSHEFSQMVKATSAATSSSLAMAAATATATATAAAVDGLDQTQQHSQERYETRTTTRSFVTIAGLSGTGKSSLARTLRGKCIVHGAFYVVGKFDLKQMDEPFSGLKSPMADICSQIRKLPKRSSQQQTTNGTSQRHSLHTKSSFSAADRRCFDDLRDRIVRNLDVTELQVLSGLVPNIEDIIGADVLSGASHGNTASRTNTSASVDTGRNTNANANATSKSSTPHRRHVIAKDETNKHGYREQSDRLKFAFRRFIKVICDHCPLVWVSDDMQWADKASLNMIESWVLDTEISSLMVVACYRSNLVGPDHDNPCQRMLQSIHQAKQDRSIRTAHLRVGDLSVEHVHTMLAELLGSELRVQDTQGLAEIVHKKTDGNVFFVQQLMKLLVHEDLLSCSIATGQWKWDNDTIQRDCPATTNVVELMKSKLRQVANAKLVLPVAACLGSTFSIASVCQVIRGFRESNDDLAFYKDLFQSDPPADNARTVQMLQTCEEEGLIDGTFELDSGLGDGDDASGAGLTLDSASSNTVTEGAFIHDKVQESALDMVPDTKLAELQFRIGKILLDRLSSAELARSLFIVVNLLNARLDLVPPYSYPNDQHGDDNDDQRSKTRLNTHSSNANRRHHEQDQDPTRPLAELNLTSIEASQRFVLAELNHSAGSQAVVCAAFSAAAVYFKNAIELLPKSHWKTHHAMSLDIFTAATECAFMTSETKLFRKYADEVIKLDCPMIDKMQVYHVMMDASMGNIEREKASDATDLGREVLAHFGYRFPKRKLPMTIATMFGLLRLNATVNTWTPQTMDTLPDAIDPTDMAVMKALDKLSTAAYLTKPSLLPLVLLKSVRRTFNNGITLYSPAAFAILGMILGWTLGRSQESRVCANHAIDMVQKMEDRSSEARVILLCNAFVLQFTQAFETLRKSLLRAYSIGMATGDVESALWCMFVFIDMSWFTGKSLHTLDMDCSTYSKVSADFGQMRQAECIKLTWQAILNLRGFAKDPSIMVGDACDEVTAMPRYEQQGDDFLKATLLRMKIMMATYFGDFETAADLALITFDLHHEAIPASLVFLPSSFFCSFACYVAVSMNRRSRRVIRQYKRMATRARRMIQMWNNRGNPNCAHYLAILDAERSIGKSPTPPGRFAGRSNNQHPAVTSYQKAIRLTARRGFINDRAFANERLAYYFRQHTDDEESARFHFDEAMRLYKEWGADGKVKSMEGKSNHLWQPPSEIEVTM